MVKPERWCTMDMIPSEFLMEYRFDLAKEGYQFGPTPSGVRVTGAIKGGTFEGPRLKGTIEPYGADWATVHTDDALEPDVHAVLKTDDGALIALHYTGLIYPWSKVGTGVEMYWRVAMRFCTSAEKYDWLNRVLAIGSGRMVKRSVLYKVWAVK
jgi:hypothetical protein